MKVNRKYLEKIYLKFIRQSEDINTDLEFYNWAIGWLIVLYNDLQKEIKQ